MQKSVKKRWYLTEKTKQLFNNTLRKESKLKNKKNTEKFTVIDF